MKSNQNLTIGVLSITAVIMLVGILVSGGQNSAMAIGQLDRGGDYVILTGQFNDSTEIVYITDAAAKRMNSYSYDVTTRQLAIWDTVNLDQVFGSN